MLNEFFVGQIHENHFEIAVSKKERRAHIQTRVKDGLELGQPLQVNSMAHVDLVLAWRIRAHVYARLVLHGVVLLKRSCQRQDVKALGCSLAPFFLLLFLGCLRHTWGACRHTWGASDFDTWGASDFGTAIRTSARPSGRLRTSELDARDQQVGALRLFVLHGQQCGRCGKPSFTSHCEGFRPRQQRKGMPTNAPWCIRVGVETLTKC